MVNNEYSRIPTRIEEIKSPYGIDRFILESLEKEGFSFDRNKSEYIQYCFGVYNGRN